MVNQQMLLGSWNELKGKIKEKWGILTDDDLTSFNGNVDELVGTIQRKTGQTRESVERFLDQLTTSGVASTISQAAETGRQYAQQAASRVQDAAGQMSDSVRRGYDQAGQMVRQYPAESIGVALGVGFLTGLLIGLTLRSTS